MILLSTKMKILHLIFFRLSIQDLSTHGRQPMISNSKKDI